MTWSLLAPMYLLGGLALAIPIWIHLKNQRPLQVYFFPTLRFLAQSNISSHRWRNLMKWLVLALRLAALAALALAFAQPWRHVKPTPTGEFSVLIVDVSASMRAEGAWVEAQQAALKWLAAESGKSRTAIITMGRSGQVLAPFDRSADEQRASLQTLSPTFQSTNPESALRLANQLLEAQPGKAKKITVLSDMAASAWSRVEWHQPLSPGIRFEHLIVAAQPPANVAVTGVAVPQSFWETNVAVEVKATLRNFSDKPARVNIGCSWNDRACEMQEIQLGPKAVEEIPFTVSPAELQTLRGCIQLQADDRFVPDNQRFFTVPACRPVRVGRLTSKKAESDLFIKTALLSTTGTSASRFEWVDLNPASSSPIAGSADVIFLDQGCPAITEGCAEAIKSFVKDGGSLVLFAGDGDVLLDWEKGLLPLELGLRREAGSMVEPQRFGQVHYEHPMLRPFSHPKGGDLFRVQVRRWRQFKTWGAMPLIQLENGDPILVATSVGKGHVIIWAFPPDRDWSNWPIQATFLPLVHQMIGWLQQQVSIKHDIVVGDLAGGEATTQPGFFHPAKAPAEIHAVNMDSSESETDRWNGNFEQLENPDTKIPDAPASAAMLPGTKTSLDWWLLVAVAVFSVVELGLANRTPS